jgi:hypothetical protein
LTRLLHDKALSASVMNYELANIAPKQIGPLDLVRIFLRGLRRGGFAMSCAWMEMRGEHEARRVIRNGQFAETINQPSSNQNI